MYALQLICTIFWFVYLPIVHITECTYDKLFYRFNKNKFTNVQNTNGFFAIS